MPSPRPFFAARQHPNNQHSFEPRIFNGLFWSGTTMNDASPDEPLFPFRSLFAPFDLPTNMPQSDEHTKQPPQPAPSIQDRLAPVHDYADKAFRRFHHHHISDSSTTGSNDSSPTTTISTVDDSSATEPSPGSSPESPPPTSFATGMLRPRTSDDSRSFFELQKQPPPRKGRNLKNLAVNTSRAPGQVPSTPSLPLAKATPALSTNNSPSFVKPPTPPKRKGSNLGLTLLTPGIPKAAPQDVRVAIPPTPSFGRPGTLRHFQSSPSLPLFPELQSPNYRPGRVYAALDTILSPAQPEHKSFNEEEEQNYDVPLSKEEKPDAYPDGPICVYEPHIDLYLEPTAEQARQYDVIMNVANEVRNPFFSNGEPAHVEPEIRIDGGGGIQFAPKRDRVIVPRPEAEPASPTTPKATPIDATFRPDDKSAQDPEYIHIKWEHNSDIVPDLLRLVKLIDEKVMQDKRLLIHCQCGVSRSASLVVAYGLYKDPSLSVQEAYDAVKQRSKWIGPNMNLIMQLQEFRSSLMRGGLLSSNRGGLSPLTPGSAISEWGGPFMSNSLERSAPPSAAIRPLSKAQTFESLHHPSISLSSAPSPTAWELAGEASGQRARAISAVKPGSAYVNPSGRLIPVLNVVGTEGGNSTFSKKQIANAETTLDTSGSATPTEPTLSPRSDEFAMIPLQPSPADDPADRFGLMSPTSTEFSSSPFDRSILLAQNGMGPIGQQTDLAPRRSISVRSKPSPKDHTDPAPANKSKGISRLRGKLSSPSIREQQLLQSLQAEIQTLSPNQSPQPTVANGIDDALMSPRATEFTENPFALSLSIPEQPASEKAAGITDSDPRSPAQKGASPIIRSIFDVL